MPVPSRAESPQGSPSRRLSPSTSRGLRRALLLGVASLTAAVAVCAPVAARADDDAPKLPAMTVSNTSTDPAAATTGP